jgi:pyruvate dehydrogenase E2 component (dihydrolipoamide acetyltransferase)
MAIEITMPRLSDTMEQGTIIKWNVKEGDEVSAGDAVADIETDKATMEMQVYDDGTVARIVVGEGQTVEVGTLIAVVAEPDEDIAEVAASVEATAAPAPPSADEAAPAPPDASTGDGRIKMTPVARRLADDHGIDTATIQGSGPSGRIVKRDVLRAVEAKTETAAAVPPSAKAVAPAAAVHTAVPTTPVSVEPPVVEATPIIAAPTGMPSGRMELSNIRQTIARRLVEAKTTIPHYQVTVAFDMDPLLDLRGTLNEQLTDQGVKLSVNDFLVRGCALSIHEHPAFNAAWGCATPIERACGPSRRSRSSSPKRPAPAASRSRRCPTRRSPSQTWACSALTTSRPSSIRQTARSWPWGQRSRSPWCATAR